jgi:hypothetical protein
VRSPPFSNGNRTINPSLIYAQFSSLTGRPLDAATWSTPRCCLLYVHMLRAPAVNRIVATCWCILHCHAFRYVRSHMRPSSDVARRYCSDVYLLPHAAHCMSSSSCIDVCSTVAATELSHRAHCPPQPVAHITLLAHSDQESGQEDLPEYVQSLDIRYIGKRTGSKNVRE